MPSRVLGTSILIPAALLLLAAGCDSGNGTNAKAATPARKPVAGPPRRVKRKKGGGGARR